MTVIGIDASTRSTGLSCFKDGELYRYHLIRSTNKDVYERIKDIGWAIKEFIKIYKPDYIFIENVPLASTVNRLVAEHLLVLQGVIFSFCMENNIKFKPMQPTNWRRLAGVKPNGRKREDQKKAAIELVANDCGIDVKWVDKKTDEKTGDSDIAEAILIAKAGLKYLEELLEGGN